MKFLLIQRLLARRGIRKKELPSIILQELRDHTWLYKYGVISILLLAVGKFGLSQGVGSM